MVAESLPRSEPFADGRTIVVTGAAGAVGRRVLARLEQDPGVMRIVAIDVADVIPGQPKPSNDDSISRSWMRPRC